MRNVEPDLTGRVVAITGATSGIGRATAEALARMGARVLACGRNPDKLRAAVSEIRCVTGNDDVEGLVADLASLAEVRFLASEIRERTDRLHVLINNAGLAMGHRAVSADGFELTFAVNHLAPFLLTTELLDLLRASAPARVITVSSAVHAALRHMDLDDLRGETDYAWMEAYKRSKLANVLFTRGLSGRLQSTGVTANCLHPGVIATGFGGSLAGILKRGWELMKLFLPGPEVGARTSIYLASAFEVAEVTGQYFDNCRVAAPGKLALDDDLAERLWRVSERACLQNR